MKKIDIITLIISVIALAAAVSFGIISIKNGKPAEKAQATAEEREAHAGEIVYVELDRILQEYDMANDKRSVVETKVQNIQAEINRRGKKLEKDIADYQDKMNKGLMTRSVAEVNGQKLQKAQEDFNVYAQQKQAEIQEEQIVMMNQLADAIKTYLDKYNEDMGYSMILTNQGGAPVITADTTLDITDAVIAGLNEEYIATKSQN